MYKPTLVMIQVPSVGEWRTMESKKEGTACVSTYQRLDSTQHTAHGTHGSIHGIHSTHGTQEGWRSFLLFLLLNVHPPPP